MNTLKITKETKKEDIIEYIEDIVDYISADDIIDMIVNCELELDDLLDGYEMEGHSCLLLNSDICYHDKISLIKVYHELFVDKTTMDEYEKSKHNVITKNIDIIFMEFINFIKGVLDYNRDELNDELYNLDDDCINNFINENEDDEVDFEDILNYFDIYYRFLRKKI